MFRISKLTDYGTVVMTYLAQQPEQVRSASEIAGGTHVAMPTVSKILKALARAQLVVSHRGAKGGYALARPPRAISMAQIIAAMEGPFGLTECSSVPGVCAHESCCSVRPNWQRINQGIRTVLESVTLAEMADMATVAAPAPVPNAVRYRNRPPAGRPPSCRSREDYGNRDT